MTQNMVKITNKKNNPQEFFCLAYELLKIGIELPG